MGFQPISDCTIKATLGNFGVSFKTFLLNTWYSDISHLLTRASKRLLHFLHSLSCFSSATGSPVQKSLACWPTSVPSVYQWLHEEIYGLCALWWRISYGRANNLPLSASIPFESNDEETASSAWLYSMIILRGKAFCWAFGGGSSPWSIQWSPVPSKFLQYLCKGECLASSRIWSSPFNVHSKDEHWKWGVAMVRAEVLNRKLKPTIYSGPCDWWCWLFSGVTKTMYQAGVKAALSCWRLYLTPLLSRASGVEVLWES